MTHTDLVTRAASWLRNSLHCGVVLTEPVAAFECPDAIGWVNGRTILVECKASRSDFYADLRKPQRHPSSKGAMGNWRFYLAPDGVVDPERMPDGWGLYVVRGRSVLHSFGQEYRNAVEGPFGSNEISERRILISALRKAQALERSRATMNVCDTC